MTELKLNKDAMLCILDERTHIEKIISNIRVNFYYSEGDIQEIDIVACDVELVSLAHNGRHKKFRLTNCRSLDEIAWHHEYQLIEWIDEAFANMKDEIREEVSFAKGE